MKPSAGATVTAYIALGSNLGEREHFIRAALQMLNETPGVKVTGVSSLLENPAVGGPDESPSFLNAAAELQVGLTASALLDRMLEIEARLGRERRTRWAPRTIDLDLVLFGNEVIHSQRLRVPHPRLHERDFVLRPLAEIGPDVVHPLLRRTVQQLLQSLEQT